MLVAWHKEWQDSSCFPHPQYPVLLLLHALPFQLAEE